MLAQGVAGVVILFGLILIIGAGIGYLVWFIKLFNP